MFIRTDLHEGTATEYGDDKIDEHFDGRDKFAQFAMLSMVPRFGDPVALSRHHDVDFRDDKAKELKVDGGVGAEGDRIVDKGEYGDPYIGQGGGGKAGQIHPSHARKAVQVVELGPDRDDSHTKSVTQKLRRPEVNGKTTNKKLKGTH